MPRTSLAAPLVDPAEAWRAGIEPRDARGARALLDVESRGGRRQRSVYELFAEMEEKDGHLYGVLRTRINGLLGLPRSLANAGPAESPADLAVREALAAFPRFDEFLNALLDGIAKGFSVVELLWDYDARGRLVVADWIAHPQEWFLFDARGRLMLLAPPFAAPRDAVADPADAIALDARTSVVARAAVAPPARKFVVLRFGRDARNPFGRGLCQRAYWYYWFKKRLCSDFPHPKLLWWLSLPTVLGVGRPRGREEPRRR